MAWNTTGYRPDAQLAKQMAGGGFGSLMAGLGGAGQQFMAKIEADKKWKADQDYKAKQLMNQKLGLDLQLKSMEQAQARHADTFGLKKKEFDTEQDLLDQKQMAQYAADTATLRAANPDAAYPSYEVAKGTGDAGFANIVGDMTSQVAELERQRKLEAAESDRLFRESLKKMGIVPKEITYGQPKEMLVNGAPQMVSFGSDNNYYLAGGKRVLGNVTDIKNTPTTMEQQPYYDKATKLFNKARDILGSSNAGYVVDMFSGADMNEHKDKMIDSIASYMMNNPYAKEHEVMDHALHPYYSRNKLTKQYELTQDGKLLNGINEKLKSGEITPYELKLFYDAKGKATGDVDFEQMATVINQAARDETLRKTITKAYNDTNHANTGVLDRLAHSTQSVVFNVAGAINDYILDDKKQAKKYRSQADKLDDKGEAWEKFNAQANIPKIAVDIGKYLAPTWGVTPVKAGTKIMTSILTGAKFGAVDGVLAKVYGEDATIAAMFAGGAGFLIGPLVRNGLKIENPKLKEAYTKWNTSHASKYKATENGPVYKAGANPYNPRVNSVDEYLKYIRKITATK